MQKEKKINGQSKTFRLVLSALMLALSTVLSFTPFELPFGGSVTLASMAPLVVVSQLYGLSWGLFTCTAAGLIQLVIGFNNFSYATTIWAVIAILLFDYIIAFGCMGFSALTRKMKHPAVAAPLGALIGCSLRFVCHFISGVAVWSEWASVSELPTFLQDTFLAKGDWLIYSYSFFYNLSYMLPETIITMVVSVIIFAALRSGRKSVQE